MMNFNQQSSATGNIELIPNGVLSWVVVTVKGIKISPKTGSRYAELELTLKGGKYERRKIFTNIGDPSYAGNSDEFKKMGYGALSRILEASRIVNFQDPASYNIVNGKSFDDVMRMIDGKDAAIKVRVVPERDGYQAKNEVAEWLSPNPVSTSSKDFQKLISGDTGGTQQGGGNAPAAPANPFAGAAQQQMPAQQQAWGQAGGTGTAQGFQQPQQGFGSTAPAAAHQTQQPMGAPSAATAPQADVNTASGWLAQAQNGQPAS